MVDPPGDAPDPERFADSFTVYEIRGRGDEVRYVGDPVAPRDGVVEAVWPAFREAGYEVELVWEDGEFVLVARPLHRREGIPWTNVALFVLTVATTLYAGAGWYYVSPLLIDGFPWINPDIVDALPFTLAVLGVLGTHELGHYVVSRYHDVDASLPYFIPMLPPFGTMGAVIRMRGRIPDRRVLFDIGVAGPLAGLVATVVVTVIGLTLPPVTVPPWVLQGPNIVIEFGYPPLLVLLADLVGEPLSYQSPRTVVNPVVLGGWIGMFVTFLNLIPVGQLDGGHITRAIIGPAQRRMAMIVPLALFGLAGYLYFLRDIDQSVGIWVLWGVLTYVVATVGPADPVVDEPLDHARILVGGFTLLLGVLCFTPIPIRIGG